MGFIYRVAGAIVFIVSSLSWSALGAHADPSVAVPGLTLQAPLIADVGAHVRFNLVAQSWPGAAAASIRFVSPHHGFTGRMQWENTCRCFTTSVPLGKIVHPLEAARAWGTVRFKSGTSTAFRAFQIRGLAPGGKQYAPGGSPYLQAWVGDPQPRRAEVQHYCAWVHAADNFGIAGVIVRIVIHQTSKPTTLTAGKTNSSGIACTDRSIGTATVGKAVAVDVYAGALHSTARFTPRT